jgi:hypothetical protein
MIPFSDFSRILPLLPLPLPPPLSQDILFLQYAVFFYGYGTYLHWGYESDWPGAHHAVLNSAFQVREFPAVYRTLRLLYPTFNDE